MTLSPQQIRETRFKPAKRGFDQDEVSAFQGAVADALESAQNDATAMEARARAAVARLQELSASGTGAATGATDTGDAPAPVRHSVDEAETISRTLLLAQRTADTTIADAETEAARLLTYKAARLKDANRNFTLTAAQAKLKTGRLAVRCAEEAVQIHGGYGYIEEYPVCRMYRDAKILTIGEGTDEVQQMVIARALGA